MSARPPTALLLFDLNQPVAPDYDFTEDFKQPQFETERDVFQALQQLGYQVQTLALHDTLIPLLSRLQNDPPDLVFNLAESLHNARCHEPYLAGLLDMMHVPYTGARPIALAVCKEKALAKKILTFHHIKTPRFAHSLRRRPLQRLHHLRYPVFVKPSEREGSEGIAQAALAPDEKSALQRVEFVHQSLKSDALVEEYIEGRELFAAVIGNQRIQVLPLIELFVGDAVLGSEDAPPGAPQFFTYKAKWDEEYRKRWGIKAGPAEALPPGVAQRIADTARRACRVLQVNGHARVDMRLTPSGEVFVIEVNPNPNLAKQDEFAMAAARANISYPQLIARVIRLARREGR